MIYLDNAASAPVLPAALDAAMPYLTQCCGNPSSIHTQGRNAALAIINARKSCAEAINATPGEIIFTSGGTESDNLAIHAAAQLGKASDKRHIITTSIEHAAVLNTCKSMEAQGFEVTYIPPDSEGIIHTQAIADAIRPDTALVSVMAANNEIGTLQPISEIGRLCRSKDVIFHTDAVQAIGSIEIDVKDMCIDMLSCSAHKLGGLKGSGFLFCREGIDIYPMIHGGGQENGLRSGTENVAGIVALGSAISHSCKDIKVKQQSISKLRDKLISLLLSIPDSRLNGSAHQRLCGNVNVSFCGIEGESLVLNLDLMEVCGSSGSACASGSTEPSHVLKAIGLSEEYQRGSLRLTLSEHNTEEEILYTAKTVSQIVERARRITGYKEKL